MISKIYIVANKYLWMSTAKNVKDGRSCFFVGGIHTTKPTQTTKPLTDFKHVSTHSAESKHSVIGDGPLGVWLFWVIIFSVKSSVYSTRFISCIEILKKKKLL